MKVSLRLSFAAYIHTFYLLLIKYVRHYCFVFNHDAKASNKNVYSFISTTFGNIIFYFLLSDANMYFCISYDTILLNVS